MTFREAWQEAVERKNSVLCAGLDPADFEMGRGEEGLPKGIFKDDWAEKYIKTVAPHVAAVKPNFNYWKGRDDGIYLDIITQLCKKFNIVLIDDSKLADIGDTNDAGLYYSKKRGFHAVTIAPYAGNMQQTAEAAKKRGISVITMCLMSNEEYGFEKNALMQIRKDDEILPEHQIFLDNSDVANVQRSIRNLTSLEGNRSESYVRRYIQLAHHAQRFGVDGIVIGAPSSKNHIQDFELQNVRAYVDNKMLVLLPAVGKQGGDASIIWQYFGRDNVIVNVGRDLMFPGAQTWEQKAEYYKNMLNNTRGA